jgi:tetratricopeptide (TPR) repeat protein
MVTAEANRPTEDPDALDYLFRARAAGWRPPSRHKYAEQIHLLERALALDPLSIEARTFLAIALTSRVISGMADAATADIARAEEIAGQVVEALPRNPLMHFAKGQVLRAQYRFGEAIPEYEAAIERNRNFVSTLHPLGQCKLFVGLIQETIPLEEQAIRLSPRDPELLGVWYSQIGLVHLLQSRTDQAIIWLEKARGVMPGRPDVHASLAAAYALKGGTESAAAELAEAALEQRRPVYEHRPIKGRRKFRSAEDLGLVRSHLFRRSAQGRDAGGVRRAASSNSAVEWR